MKRECLTCGKISDSRKDFFELAGQTGPRDICRSCAAELGINSFMSAGFKSNTSVLKKYVKIHPEAQIRLDQQLARINSYKADMKAELNELTKHSGCTKKKQTKCTCLSCKNTYYYGDYDVVKNVANAFHGSLYAANKVKDLDQCPKCGSRAISKKDVYFWIDKKGNCIDVKE